MIVVVGSLAGRREPDRIAADGLAALIALAAAGSGQAVQVVGRVGDDPQADAVLQDLARGGVGHAAILRDAAHATPMVGPDSEGSGEPPAGRPEVEGADIDLALRYLTDFRVLVLTDVATQSVVTVAAQAVDWGEAALIVVRAPGGSLPAGLPNDAVTFEIAPDETDGAFATRVASMAVALDVAPAGSSTPR